MADKENGLIVIGGFSERLFNVNPELERSGGVGLRAGVRRDAPGERLRPRECQLLGVLRGTVRGDGSHSHFGFRSGHFGFRSGRFGVYHSDFRL